MLRNAKRFFRKTLKALHTSSPRVITVDKNAAYLKAINELKPKKELPKKVKLRQKKYLNNIVEQDHRVKRLVKPGMGCGLVQHGSKNNKRLRGYEHGEKRTLFRLPKGLSKNESNSSTKYAGVVA